MSRLIIMLMLGGCFWPGMFADRLKDISEVEGVRSNPLVGYGLVVGLDGTGDKDQTKFTIQALTNALQKMGMNLDGQSIKVKNVAAVMVTTKLPPFARIGLPLDVTISSIGDAKSLLGGTLLITPLTGADGQIYAVAQGAMSVGGFAVGNAQKNHPTVGTIPGGALVEKNLNWDVSATKKFVIYCIRPIFPPREMFIIKLNCF